MLSEHFACVMDDHTQLKVRKYQSTRFVMPGQSVRCLSLSNIEVDPQQRRRGHARRTLRTLRSAAAQNNHVLIIESTQHTRDSLAAGSFLSPTTSTSPGGCASLVPFGRCRL